jgi:hypothetical protein
MSYLLLFLIAEVVRKMVKSLILSVHYLAYNILV